MLVNNLTTLCKQLPSTFFLTKHYFLLWPFNKWKTKTPLIYYAVVGKFSFYGSKVSLLRLSVKPVKYYKM